MATQGNWYDPVVSGIQSLSMDDLWKFATGAAGALNTGTENNVTRPWMVGGQEAGYEKAIADTKAAYAQGPQQYYPNSTIANRDPNQTAGENDMLSSTDRIQNMADTAGRGALSLSRGGADRVGGFQLPNEVGFGIPQEYQNAIMDPINRNLRNELIPGIHTAATAQGAFGGSRMAQQKADAVEQANLAATDAMIMGNLNARQQTIGQRAGDISAQLQGRNQDITQNQIQNNAMASGVDATGATIGQQLIPGQIMADVGDRRHLYDQSRLTADVNRFDWNRQENNDYLDRYIKRVNLDPGAGQVVQGQNGDYLDMLAGFANGVNMYNSTRPRTATSKDLRTAIPGDGGANLYTGF